MNNSAIEIKNVSFSAGETHILTDISLNIPPNSVTALVGQAGSGKSTLLKLSAGLLVPDEGEVFFGGKAISNFTRQETLLFRKKSSFVFQDSALWSNQDIYHILELPLLIHYPKLTVKERFQKISHMVRTLGYTRPLDIAPSQLSAGEQKQIGVARALINEPEILFLDECTQSLDGRTAEIVCTILIEMHKKGATIVFISHDSAFMDRLRGRVCVIENGKLKKNMEYEEYRNLSAFTENRQRKEVPQ